MNYNLKHFLYLLLLINVVRKKCSHIQNVKISKMILIKLTHSTFSTKNVLYNNTNAAVIVANRYCNKGLNMLYRSLSCKKSFSVKIMYDEIKEASAF